MIVCCSNLEIYKTNYYYIDFLHDFWFEYTTLNVTPPRNFLSRRFNCHLDTVLRIVMYI